MPKISTPDSREALNDSTPVDVDSPSYEYGKEVTVYLTGFGPFLNIKDNPSYNIISSFSSRAPIRLPNSNIIIHIIPHPEPVRVAYASVDTIIPEIYDSNSFDYILHVGAGLDGGYEIEKMAWEEGYLRGDVDGLIPGRKPGLDEKAMRKLILSEKASHWGGNNADVDRREDGDTKGWWASALDVDWIAGEAARGSGGGGKGREGEQYVCKRSFNAGRYLCEYIYYTSLRVAVSRRPPQGTVNKHKHKSHHHGPEETSNTTKRVLFLHVPQFGKPYELEDGQEIVKRIVKAMVIDGEGLRRKG